MFSDWIAVCRGISRVCKTMRAGGPSGDLRSESQSGLTSIDRLARISVILYEQFLTSIRAQGQFMKQVAILLLMAIMLNGCSSTRTLQSTTSGIFQAVMFGGVGDASGFSFITQFTVNTDFTLNVSSFQFLTQNSVDNNPCFPINGGTVSGNIANYLVNSNDTVSGTLTYTVKSGGNTLTLTGAVTGTATVTGTGTNTSTTLTSASVAGNWAMTGSGTPAGCVNAGGPFTMTES
jgi:hypothetical protein